MTEPTPLLLDDALLRSVIGRLASGESLEHFVEAAVHARLADPDRGEETEYLRGLQAITAALANARDLGEICAVVLNQAGSGGERAIWRLDGGKLLLVAGSEPSLSYPEIPLDDRFPARANLASGEPLFVESRRELLERWPVLEAAPTSAFAGLPLIVEGRRLGLLALGYEEDHHFTRSERDYLRSVAEQTAVAIERAELRQARDEAQLRRELLAEAMFELSTPHSSPDALLQQLAHLSVPRFADWCVVFVRRSGRFERVAGARSAVITDQADTYASARPIRELLVAAGASDSEAGVLAAEPGSSTPGTEALLEHLGLSSLIVVPLAAQERAAGLMLFGGGPERPIFRSADLSLATSLAARATIALENHRTAQESKAFAETITRAILPGRFPDLDRIDFGACFEPAGAGSIGGDWYDVFELRDGVYGVVVGDVSGHGVQAAAAMARLRNGLFAFASEGHPPATALARLAPLLAAPDSEDDGDLIATVKLAALYPQSCLVDIANAGHPPFLLLRNGHASFGPGGGTVLSTSFEPRVSEYSLALEPGDLLLFYTDGLVERPREPYNESFDRLAHVAEALRDVQDLDEFCRRLVEATEPETGRRDDCCVIALRVSAGR